MKFVLPIIIGSLFLFFSCSSNTKVAEDAKQVFNSIIQASVENDSALLERHAPYTTEMSSEEKLLLQSFFVSFGASDVIQNFKAVSNSKCIVSLYLPSEKLNLEITMEKNENNEWILLPQWRQTVSLDTVTLD